ncbi:alpha/beta hydrolase domain-containing protein [Frankia sp. R43]|uniref:alpha/beta hydrolase domain-containing protein n=1 Tax=Frankia sp. R43 TaxID=269536 RepID=UPI0006CA0A60|nr:alpha/beta hydrolase domain-containing protein [Frankia sp. R43]
MPHRRRSGHRGGNRGLTATPAPGLVLALILALLSACSGDGEGASGSAAPAGTGTAGTGPSGSSARPAGPAADLATELSGGNGPFTAAGTPADLGSAGYTQRELAAAGTASSYRAVGALGADGRWMFAPDTSAPFRTRVLVRRPTAAERFSGTVIVEWLNVSVGLDSDAEWTTLHEEITRRGDVWVGVSAQRIGVQGGPVLVPVTGAAGLAGKGLTAIDPARYGTLNHPGDGFSYDILTQVARAVRSGAGLDGLRPQRLIAAGESQSAYALVTYHNGVQPLTRAFDGFLVHSRGATGLGLVGPGENADLVSVLNDTPTIFRTDLDAPVLDVQTESDLTGVLNSARARQPDNPHLRLWEVAGTAHADARLLGPAAAVVDCGVSINNGPLHFVAKAALRALTVWLTTGAQPPVAPRIEVAAGGEPHITRDADGIAVGGIRTPPVDVPVSTLSGAGGPNTSTICALAGSSRPFTSSRLGELYSSAADYRHRYDEAAKSAVNSGFILTADLESLRKAADTTMIPS